MTISSLTRQILIFSLAALPSLMADEPQVDITPMAWQQLSPKLSFSLAVERERYTNLDRSARFVFFVETGRNGPALETLQVNWTVRTGNRDVSQQLVTIAQGLVCVDMDLKDLNPGRYDITAQLLNGAVKLAEQQSFFRIETTDAPAQAGRIPLLLPAGMPLKHANWPVQTGVPFPKGALWDTEHVRLVDARGRAVPCGLTVRSRWGSGTASIRWLGLDFQASAADAWWPERRQPQYFLEFGPEIGRTPAEPQLKVEDIPDGLEIDTGAISFLVRRRGFNLLDKIRLAGRPVLNSDASHGLYLVDHEGTTYRAANDTEVLLTIEEQNDLRVVVRAEGWYVKDGATARKQDARLPTDLLCRFITRIEAYAGKPYVRVLSTWINTFDTFTVRLRDIGISVPANNRNATFGVLAGEAVSAPVPDSGIRLVQHLHDRFVIEDGKGRSLADGAKSAGWVIARGPDVNIAVSNRDTWQRFPKELEVLPDSVRLHVWPAHGKDHPETDIFAKDQIHRLWSAHQGKELNMALPWNYYFAVKEYALTDQYGKPGEHAFLAVQDYGMGTAVTSDFLLHFALPEDNQALATTATCFQAAPHALTDPQWLCDSLAMGYIHPYDPENFRGFEEMIHDGMRGYWNTQNAGNMFGMWIYRSWHHSAYNGDGSWIHYRLFNGTHHGEAIMPWIFYARSGDPFYLNYGRANIRQLADIQIVHHADMEYEQEIGIQPGKHKLVGATKHDNCIVPWGADHQVFGHQTCYNGLILSYYLTGDLRLREVLVDEWQRTITTARHLPAIQSPYGDCASALAQGRDNANPVSDLIDLYQLTYNPQVLAVLKPRLDMFLYGNPAKNDSFLYTAWGHALHNVILFHGMESVKKSLLELMARADAGTEEARRSAKTGSDTETPAPHVETGIWKTIDRYRPEEAYAMAGILDPEADYSAQVMFCNAYARGNLQRLAQGEKVVLASIPDYLRPLPRMMYALMHSSHRDLAGVLGDTQPLPLVWGDAPLHCIVRKDRQQDIKIHINGTVSQKEGLAIQVVDPDGAMISRETVPPGRHAAHVITLPEDGKTGEYVIFLFRTRDDNLSVPLTTLPEVYLLPGFNTFWDRKTPRPAQFFTRAPGNEACDLIIGGERTKVFAADRKTMLGFTDTERKTNTVRIGPDGAWLGGWGGWVAASHAADKTPAILSINTERWFQPGALALERKPAP